VRHFYDCGRVLLELAPPPAASRAGAPIRSVASASISSCITSRTDSRITRPVATFSDPDREPRPGLVGAPIWGIEVNALPMTATGKILKRELT